MSASADFDENASKRTFTAPYTGKHQVPTIQGYQAEKEKRERNAEDHRPSTPSSTSPVAATVESDAASSSSPKSSKRKSFMSSAKGLLRRDSVKKDSSSPASTPYKTQNRNLQPRAGTPLRDSQVSSSQTDSKPSESGSVADPKTTEVTEDVSPALPSSTLNGKAVNGQIDGIHDQIDPGSAQQLAHGHEHEASGGVATSDAGAAAESHGLDTPKDMQQDADDAPIEDTSESVNDTQDPRQKRKNMKHMKRDDTDRHVTDPITHLPVKVHDSTSEHLNSVPENEPAPGTQDRTATGVSGKTKSSSQLDQEGREQQDAHQAMERLFPPPSFDVAKAEIADVFGLAFVVGSAAVLSVPMGLLVLAQLFYGSHDRHGSWLALLAGPLILLTTGMTVGGGMIFGLRTWLQKRIAAVWDDQVWDAVRQQDASTADSQTPESVQWLNSLLSSVWALVNPDLFASLVDTLEDVMQASLPKLVRMVSVEDLGQGSEAIRILGVKWLPTGAAARDVLESGQLKSPKSNEGSGKDSKDAKADNENAEDVVGAGLEAEEGDFVNLEIAFSYRASSSGKSLTEKTKNAHLFLGFYLPGGIKFPVWVELRGIVGTMRLRLQLCPDPPFFALCTITLLGQPKADLACVPLTKKGLNIMDLPLISSFVQSSIDAALAEYVAPKSLTLDIKDMLLGDDFKKDTTTRGVVMVRIKQGYDFKAGDPGTLGIGQGSSDGYVAVGWAKFGKPVWSTRVIVDDMQPVWEETAFILVGPDELNAEERLRIQLWDSDKFTADDDLGRIEVDLKELMTGSETHGKMKHRSDGFRSLKKGSELPGKLDWSVGYFPKVRIQSEQLEGQKVEPDVNSLQELKERVGKDTQRKLREARARDESFELDQQKAQDLKIREDAMIIATPPLKSHPSGIFSIEIHNITGLELERLNKTTGNSDVDDAAEGSGDLPSAYCTIILNHQTIYKTRTKPKNAKPFYAAGCERMIRDWRSTEVVVAVRDARIHENDALLGIVYLPLGKLFQNRSQVIDSFPLVGGIGYGRARISILFRSLEVQLPSELQGWDYGTVEITGPITGERISHDLHELRMKIRTTVNRGKLYPDKSMDGEVWTGKRKRSVYLAVRKRYCSCIIIEFRKNALGLDKTPAFGVLWLKDIPDEEDTNVTVPIWRMDKEKFKRGTTNCVDDLGERLGDLTIPLKFHRGLSSYHHKLSRNNPAISDVMEVLHTVHDQDGLGDDDDAASSSPSSDSSDSDADSDSVASGKKNPNIILKKMGLTGDKSADSDSDDIDDGKGGPTKQFKEYNQKSEHLHRRHRGIMQFKGVRTADWVKTKVEHGKDHMLDKFTHHERDPGVETEV